MGIDVYMKWNKQTKAEHDKQITGFNITCGKFGYLRASYGMTTECAILERIFPPEYWKCKKVRFDFRKGSATILDLLTGYIQGEKIHSDTLKEKTKVYDLMKSVFSGQDWEIQEPKLESEEEKIYWRKVWAKSLIEFFRLGIEKQDEGKNPAVYISY